MASTRYGRIYHSDYSYINLRFQSTDERNTFTEKFNAYHASHDHDGEVPRFENEVASKIGNPQAVTIHDAHSVSIDGYATYEIEEYHNPGASIARRGRYKPPTCCVAPVISIDRAFVQSDTLTRHELSAIFTDIPDEEFASMLQSVERDGFMDPMIRLIGTEVLDGWHRYTAAKELNLLRKLRFQQWDAEKEGDPAAFVYARNQHRRHQSAAKRAQITVLFNERYGLGTNRYTLGTPNGEPKTSDDSPNDTPKPKTREELAKEAGVGTSTIDRAIAIEKEGESEAVIRGEKTAGEVLLAKDRETAKQAETQMWETFKVIEEKVTRDAFKRGACRHHTNWGVADIPAIEDMKSPKVWAARFDLLNGEIRAQATWIKALITEDTEEPPTETGSQEERGAAIAKKRKKQVLKNMWDTRIQAARDYTGDSDTDLNQYLSLDDLEKGFAKSNESMAEAFTSGMKRIDRAGSFQNFQDRAFEVDEHGVAKVDISALEEESKAIAFYAGDIRQWERPDWSPDTNWILPLIEASKKKAKASEDAPKPDAEPEPDLKTLREQVKAAIPKYKQWYKDQGYKESELISRASFSQLIHVLREYRETEQDGTATIEELKDLLQLLKSKSYPLAHKLRQTKSEAKVSTQPSGCEDTSLPIVRPEQSESDSTEVTSPADAGCEVIDESDPDEDTSLAEIENLPAVKYSLETLYSQVGTFIHPNIKDDVSCAIFDLFIEQFEDMTERQQVSVLIDVAHSILVESESV